MQGLEDVQHRAPDQGDPLGGVQHLRGEQIQRLGVGAVRDRSHGWNYRWRSGQNAPESAPAISAITMMAATMPPAIAKALPQPQ